MFGTLQFTLRYLVICLDTPLVTLSALGCVGTLYYFAGAIDYLDLFSIILLFWLILCLYS